MLALAPHRHLSLSQDLLKHTPADHPDYPLLQDALRISQNFLSSINEDIDPRRTAVTTPKGEVRGWELAPQLGPFVSRGSNGGPRHGDGSGGRLAQWAQTHLVCSLQLLPSLQVWKLPSVGGQGRAWAQGSL